MQRIDRLLLELSKPKLRPVNGPLEFHSDVLVLCGGFEDRATEFAKHITEKAAGHLRVIVVDYLPRYRSNRTREILRLCSNVGLDAQVFRYDRRNPAGLGEEIVKIIPREAARVWIDISSMSRLLIVQLLVALAQRTASLSNVSILYAEAKSYPPTKEQVDEALAESESDPLHAIMFLSSGVFDVTVVPELSSVAQLGQPIRLIAFPCFIVQQLVALRAETQASQLTIIHGVPPRNDNAWRPDAVARLNHVSDMPRKIEFKTSTMDYRETLNLLLKIYDEHGAMDRIVIAPTGSKMQAVAVGLFRSYLNDVQVIYPPPRHFAKPREYTQGVRQLYSLNLDTFPPAR